MITLTFTGSAQEVIADMQSLLRQDPANVPVASEAAVEEAAKPAPKPRTTKPAAEKPSPDKEPEEKAATKKAAQSSASDDVDVTDYDSVKKFLGTAITTLGAQLVQEAMAEQGATKVGDLAPTKYKPLVARLQDLMDRKDEE